MDLKSSFVPSQSCSTVLSSDLVSRHSNDSEEAGSRIALKLAFMLQPSMGHGAEDKAHCDGGQYGDLQRV